MVDTHCTVANLSQGHLARHCYVIAVAVFLCSVTVLTSIVGIVGHLRHRGPKGISIYTVRILLLAPLYSVFSLIAVSVHKEYATELNASLELVRKFYEFVVIFAFLQLLVAQLGGFERLGSHLTDDDCVHLPPVKYCFDKYSWTPPQRFIRRSLSCVLQYAAVAVIVVPMFLVLHLAIKGKSFKGIGNVCTFAVGGSQGIAMYGLVLFYHANHKTLEPIRPVRKLISIKLLLIATNMQQMGIVFLSENFHIFKSTVAAWEHFKGEEGEAKFAEFVINCLILVEMFILSFYHLVVFPPGEDLALTSPPQGAAEDLPNGSPATDPPPNASANSTSELELPAASYIPDPGSFPATADATPSADELVAGDSSPSRLRRWVGSDRWGRHVQGEQTQLRQCCGRNCALARRFYYVFDITDILFFYRELRANYRTASTDNLDASNAHRYVAGFFRPRHSLRRDQSPLLQPEVHARTGRSSWESQDEAAVAPAPS